MTKVFINFRNGDDPYAAALLYRALGDHYGTAAVFRSSESIRPGTRWAQEIWANHRRCAVLIAVIGPRWLSVTDQEGRRKLDRDGDWVRAELAVALAEDKLVLPVLLQGAPRLARADLPGDLIDLADLQAVSMDHRHVDLAVAALIERISPAIEPPARRGGRPRHRRSTRGGNSSRNISLSLGRVKGTANSPIGYGNSEYWPSGIDRSGGAVAPIN